MTPLIEALLKLKKITKRDLKEAQALVDAEARALTARLDFLSALRNAPKNDYFVSKAGVQRAQPVQNPKAPAKKQASPAQTKHRKMHGKLMGMARNLPQESKDAIWQCKKEKGYPAAIKLAREVSAALQNPS